MDKSLGNVGLLLVFAALMVFWVNSQPKQDTKEASKTSQGQFESLDDHQLSASPLSEAEIVEPQQTDSLNFNQANANVNRLKAHLQQQQTAIEEKQQRSEPITFSPPEEMQSYDFSQVPRERQEPLQKLNESPLQKLESDSTSPMISNPFFDQAESKEASDPVLTLHSLKSEPRYTSTEQPSQLPTTQHGSFESLVNKPAKQATVEGSSAYSNIQRRRDITPAIPRSEEIVLSASQQQQCINHIEYGKSLAKRGANFAAREELFSALNLIAEFKDAQIRATSHVDALRQAVMALDEVDDFQTHRSHQGVGADASIVIDSHESKIIDIETASSMSSFAAMEAYFQFAQNQIASTFGKNPIASEALFCLGKLYTTDVGNDLSGNPVPLAKANVFHRAALDCDPANYKSSNELGVLLMRNGQLENARDLFIESLRVSQSPQTWRNLATVHERLAAASTGQFSQENAMHARDAYREYQIALTRAPSQPKIQWMSAQQFNESASPEINEFRTANAQDAEVEPKSKKSVFDKFKDLF